jgi:hypothetical protein
VVAVWSLYDDAIITTYHFIIADGKANTINDINILKHSVNHMYHLL